MLSLQMGAETCTQAVIRSFILVLTSIWKDIQHLGDSSFRWQWIMQDTFVCKENYVLRLPIKQFHLAFIKTWQNAAQDKNLRCCHYREKKVDTIIPIGAKYER